MRQNTSLIASVETSDKTLPSTATTFINLAIAMVTSGSLADDGYHQVNMKHGMQQPPM
jgi:hypothetical protein